MKTTPAYIQYMTMFLALVATANCIKHLVRLGAWESFGFILFKDLALVAFGVYLFRLSRTTENADLRNLAMYCLHGLLMMSFIGDYAIVLLNG
jgi:hypothetical protein